MSGKFFDNSGGAAPLYDESRYPEGTKALQEEIDRLTAAHVASVTTMASAAVLHWKVPKKGGEGFTCACQPGTVFDVNWPCPTLQALGTTR